MRVVHNHGMTEAQVETLSRLHDEYAPLPFPAGFTTRDPGGHGLALVDTLLSGCVHSAIRGPLDARPRNVLAARIPVRHACVGPRATSITSVIGGTPTGAGLPSNVRPSSPPRPVRRAVEQEHSMKHTSRRSVLTTVAAAAATKDTFDSNTLLYSSGQYQEGRDWMRHFRSTPDAGLFDNLSSSSAPVVSTAVIAPHGGAIEPARSALTTRSPSPCTGSAPKPAPPSRSSSVVATDATEPARARLTRLTSGTGPSAKRGAQHASLGPESHDNEAGSAAVEGGPCEPHVLSLARPAHQEGHSHDHDQTDGDDPEGRRALPRSFGQLLHVRHVAFRPTPTQPTAARHSAVLHTRTP